MNTDSMTKPTTPNEPRRTCESVEEHMHRLLQKIKTVSPEERKARQELWRRSEEAERRQRIEELRNRSDAPQRHFDTAPNFDTPWGEKFRQLQSRLGHGTILALTGPENAGKTQMAVEFLREVTGRERSALYTTAVQLFAGLKSAYDRSGKQTERDQFARYRRPRLLIIDGLQRMNASTWERNVILEILDARYGDLRDTILVSDSTLPDLQQRLGDSAVGKINHCGGFVVCGWPGFGQD